MCDNSHKQKAGVDPFDISRSNPSKMTVEIIRQFSRCNRTVQRLNFPENTFLTN